MDDWGNEDGEIAACLRNVGVYMGDSRDNLGRFRFLPNWGDGGDGRNIVDREWTWPFFWELSKHYPQQVIFIKSLIVHITLN